MKKGIIDIGSNTVNLLIGEIDLNNKLQIVVNTKHHTKLAAQITKSKMLQPSSIDATIDAISEYMETLNNHEIAKSNITVYGTASLRNAENGAYFKNLVFEKFGFEINIIAGDVEAEMIYQGIRHGFPLTEQPALIMDIGGGSVEFIIANNKTILWKESYNIGVTYLLDKYGISEPPTVAEIVLYSFMLETTLANLFEKTAFYKPKILVGASGAFDTLKDMILCQPPSTDNGTTWYSFDYDRLMALCEQIYPLNYEQRKAIVGMDPMRAAYMVVGIILIAKILNKTGIQSIFQCNYALKEGAFFIP